MPLNQTKPTTHASQLFQLSCKIQGFVYHFVFFYFHPYDLLEKKSPQDGKFFSLIVN